MLTLNDGRAELWQWDTGRTLAVDADCSQVHFSNKVFGRSIDVDVIDGAAIIPDILLQTDKDLNVWAFVGTAENGYTKISKTFTVNRRNKPADYVFTPTEQTTIDEIAAIAQSVRDDADAGLFNGEPGDNGITPHIGDNGNWYIGSEDTGKPSRGATGSPGKDGADGAPGKDGAGMDVTGATIGQIAKIAAVDASGVPTAWAPVDMPSGGGGGETWELVAEATTTEIVNSLRVTFDACSAVYVEFCWGGVENDLGDIAIYPNARDTPYAGEKRAAAAYVKSSASRKRGMLCVRMDCRVGTHWTAVSNQKGRADGAFGSINADNLMNMDIGVDPDVQYSVINSGYMTIRDDTPASGVKSITAYGAGMAIGTRIKVWGIKK